MASSVAKRLTDDLEIRVVAAPFFIAAKLEAFKGRGNGDFVASRDLEDLICVVDGRSELVTEVQAEEADLREYLRTEIKRLRQAPRFLMHCPATCCRIW
jgi:hypothetical protein